MRRAGHFFPVSGGVPLLWMRFRNRVGQGLPPVRHDVSRQCSAVTRNVVRHGSRPASMLRLIWGTACALGVRKASKQECGLRRAERERSQLLKCACVSGKFGRSFQAYPPAGAA